MQARNGLDGATNDITIGGKPGPAAFIVAVFVHCIDNNAPAASLIRHKLLVLLCQKRNLAFNRRQHGHRGSV